MSKKQKIECPNCGYEIENMDELLAKKIKQTLIGDFEQKLKQKDDSLAKERKELVEKEKKLDKQLTEKYKKQIQELEKSLGEKLSKEYRKNHNLQIQERQKIIDDLKKKLQEVTDSANRSSQQLSGEVQELAIESMLKNAYPFDEIVEIKKGSNGADCVQIVKSREGDTIGRILYESKRTKNFSKKWIAKVKKDNLQSRADIIVIVTSTLPKEFEDEFGIIDNVFVCSFGYAKELSLALRFGMFQVHKVKSTQVKANDKMQDLYDYFTGSDFKQVFTSIVEGYKTLRETHESEKRKLLNLWSTREKEMDSIFNNMVELYTSVRAISGKSIDHIDTLSLPALPRN